MRVILDTDKKAITEPWNYQAKLNDLNKLIAEYSEDESNIKNFTGYIDEIWRYCIEHSDECVVTGKKPVAKK